MAREKRRAEPSRSGYRLTAQQQGFRHAEPAGRRMSDVIRSHSNLFTRPGSLFSKLPLFQKHHRVTISSRRSSASSHDDWTHTHTLPILLILCQVARYVIALFRRLKPAQCERKIQVEDAMRVVTCRRAMQTSRMGERERQRCSD